MQTTQLLFTTTKYTDVQTLYKHFRRKLCRKLLSNEFAHMNTAIECPPLRAATPRKPIAKITHAPRNSIFSLDEQKDDCPGASDWLTSWGIGISGGNRTGSVSGNYVRCKKENMRKKKKVSTQSETIPSLAKSDGRAGDWSCMACLLQLLQGGCEPIKSIVESLTTESACPLYMPYPVPEVVQA